MKRLVFATRNPGKVVELRKLLADIAVEVVSVEEIAPDMTEVAETGTTFEANALIKARAVARHCGLPALADDSGLEVDALGGAPGVISARYAGPKSDDQANNQKLLADMAGQTERTARFRCVVALVDGDFEKTAAGSCEGRILTEPKGTGGFGYDPLFYCNDLGQTFAEAGVGPKGGVSHRARAVSAILPTLQERFRRPG